MNILGISSYVHDAAAALLCGGRLAAAAEEGRFSGVRHDEPFPSRAIESCLGSAGIKASDLDAVAYFEKPFLKFERIAMSCLTAYPRSRRFFHKEAIEWLGEKLWIKSRIARELQLDESKILFVGNHLAHAAGSFLCSPFEEAAILTVGDVGEWTTTSMGVGRGKDVKIIGELRFPHSLGLVYRTFAAFLGFEAGGGEHEAMDLAQSGKPQYLEEVKKLVKMPADASFELDLSYFEFHRTPDKMFSAKFRSVFGEPRAPDSPVTARHRDLAASVQVATEEWLLVLAREVYKRAQLPRLCLAGDLARNSAAMERILKDGPFEEIYVPPAAGGGPALGAALWAQCNVLGGERGVGLGEAVRRAESE